QRTRVLDRLPDLLPARDFPHAGVSGAVLQDEDVSREERSMGAAQVEQHAVVSRDGDHGHAGNGRSKSGQSDFYSKAEALFEAVPGIYRTLRGRWRSAGRWSTGSCRGTSSRSPRPPPVRVVRDGSKGCPWSGPSRAAGTGSPPRPPRTAS